MRKFLVFGILFVFLSAGLFFAQTAEENFEKATQAELAKREAILLEEAEEIEAFHANMANDAVITGEEMKTLDKMIRDFDKTKEKFDKELKFYSRVTQTEILLAIRKHQEIYFVEKDQDFNHRDNENQAIRRYFVEKTGSDVIVEKSKDIAARLVVGLCVGALFGLFLGCLVAFKSESGGAGIVVGFFALVVCVALCLIF